MKFPGLIVLHGQIQPLRKAWRDKFSNDKKKVTWLLEQVHRLLLMGKTDLLIADFLLSMHSNNIVLKTWDSLVPPIYIHTILTERNDQNSSSQEKYLHIYWMIVIYKSILVNYNCRFWSM